MFCQKTIPGAVVTVFADKFFDETTSHGAAGIFRPTLELMPGVSLETTRWEIIIIRDITISDANTNNISPWYSFCFCQNFYFLSCFTQNLQQMGEELMESL